MCLTVPLLLGGSEMYLVLPTAVFPMSSSVPGTQKAPNICGMKLTLSDVGLRTQLVVSLGFSQQTWLSLGWGSGTLQIQVSNVPR